VSRSVFISTSERRLNHVRLEVIGVQFFKMPSFHRHGICVWTQLERLGHCCDMSPNLLMVQTSGYHLWKDDSIPQYFTFRC